ncbi:MAG: peptidylprolyl isomerase, partial [Oscillospiraceae bacterium]|nr:peptidylprolyl isomerase [Oscillospiraceae bacterium]
MNLSWEDAAKEDGTTYAEIMVEETEKLLRQVVAQEVLAEENGIEINEELQAVIESKKEEAVNSVLGEEGTIEEFYKFLEGVYLSPEMHERLIAQEVLYEKCCDLLYGDDDQEKVTNFLSEKGYHSAAHILFLYNDPETGEVRDEETLAANKAKLEKLVKELRGYTDKHARAKAFLEKAADLSEDSGKAYYPEGYTYTPGTMVPQFEDAVSALAEYEIS